MKKKTKIKTTYTAGPWNVEDEGHLDHEGKCWVVDERGLFIAEVELSDDAIIRQKEAYANADLIASAPDLLKALKDRLSECKCRDHEDALALIYGAGNCPTCESDGAIIEKAEGR